MTLKTKIYVGVAAAAVLLFVLGISTLWSEHKLAKLESELEAARTTADQSETRAAELERRAASYEQKIEYLEASLSDLRSIAAKQDEELKTLKNKTNVTRRDVDRARAVRTLESTTADLCQRLAEVGHPCD